MNELMNDKAVYKTAPATPGLLKMSGMVIFPPDILKCWRAHTWSIDMNMNIFSLIQAQQ